MRTNHHLVLWMLLACHHTWSAQRGEIMLAIYRVIQVQLNGQRKRMLIDYATHYLFCDRY